MKIYHLTVRTRPLDWAASPETKSIGFYKTKAGAQAKIKELREKDKEYAIYYGDPQIWPVEVQE